MKTEDNKETNHFSPQLSGRGKDSHSGTSGFTSGALYNNLPGTILGDHTPGLEESGREKLATTSSAGTVQGKRPAAPNKP